MEAERCEAGPVWVSETLRVLSRALEASGAPPTAWFKESSQKNLRSRDFLVPRGALQKSFPDGEIPEDLIQNLTAMNVPGVAPIRRCLPSHAGLAVQLDRPAVFHSILKDFTPYLKPSPRVPENGPRTVILNCAALHTCRSLDSLKPSHLRAVLTADHLAEVLRHQGEHVYLAPAMPSEEVETFLHKLGIFWSCLEEKPILEETVRSYKDFLREKMDINRTSIDSGPSADESSQQVLFNVPLKSWAEKQGLCLQGYDPNLDVFQVNEGDLEHVAMLHRSVEERKMSASCTVLHVVSCEDEFHQQKLDLLWRLLDPGAAVIAQKLLVCGPVKVLSSSSAVSGHQYFNLRKSQMREASVMKYGDSVQGDSWDEIINSLTSAAIKFELMATPHRTQITLNLDDANITTKGTKSGAFVMYNCARLATMFDGYNCAVSQGLYPEFPPASDIDYSCLGEEGEWLLLFNYVMMFPEIFSQSAQISLTSPGIRVTANTEVVCKFLVSLSMDFSCYYNRVHILGEPLPHLFRQMFARLQLMKALRSILHRALETLRIIPLTQI